MIVIHLFFVFGEENEVHIYMNGHQASREPGHRNQNLFLSQYFSMNYIVNKISEENVHL